MLPGGDLPKGGMTQWLSELQSRYPALPAPMLRGLARRHGTRALAILGEAKSARDLGEDFGNGLTAAEIEYLVRVEMARDADDVLWRRTKCGLGLDEGARARVAAQVAKALAAMGR